MMTDEADLWGDTLPPTTIPAPKTNPCIAVYGPGPADTHCTDCTHLRRMQRDKTYIKCDLRKRTHGAGNRSTRNMSLSTSNIKRRHDAQHRSRHARGDYYV